jgi:hypothetical protein
MARDKNLLDGVVKYIQTEGWVDALQERLRAHTLPAIEERGLAEAELLRLLDQQVYALMFTSVVEDLMSRTSADGRNVTDAYIKRHGWKLGSTARRQLEAVRDSRMELYEIDAVTPGVGMTLRNLAGDGEKIAVEAEALARALPVGCLLGARVLRADGKVTLTGGILPFDEGMSAEGASAVAEAEDRAAGITIFWLRKTLEEQLGKIERPGALPLDPTGDKSPDPIIEEVDAEGGDSEVPG